MRFKTYSFRLGRYFAEKKLSILLILFKELKAFNFSFIEPALLNCCFQIVSRYLQNITVLLFRLINHILMILQPRYWSCLPTAFSMLLPSSKGVLISGFLLYFVSSRSIFDFQIFAAELIFELNCEIAFPFLIVNFIIAHRLLSQFNFYCLEIYLVELAYFSILVVA